MEATSLMTDTTATVDDTGYDVGLDRDASEDHLHMCGEYTWQLTILNPK